MSKKQKSVNTALPEGKYYLGVLWAFVILLLVPWYTPWSPPDFVLSSTSGSVVFFTNLFYPWWHALVFALAGIGVHHSFTRRGLGEFAKERTRQLLVPTLFGLIFIVPAHRYFAALNLNGMADYFYYFSHLVGYGFDYPLSQFTFPLFIYPMTMLLAPLASHLQRRAKENPRRASFAGKIPWPLLYLFCIVPLAVFNLVKIEAVSMGEYPVYFLLGYFLLADEGVMEKLVKYRFLSLGIFAAAFILAHFGPAALRGGALPLLGWFACMAFLGLARRYLNSGGSKILRYLSKSSFAVFLFFNVYIAISTFLFAKMTDNSSLLALFTMLSTFALTFLTYELLKRFRVTRFMFGLRR